MLLKKLDYFDFLAMPIRWISCVLPSTKVRALFTVPFAYFCSLDPIFVNFDPSLINEVAGLVKQLFRDMPQPLVPHSLYFALIGAAKEVILILIYYLFEF